MAIEVARPANIEWPSKVLRKVSKWFKPACLQNPNKVIENGVTSTKSGSSLTPEGSLPGPRYPRVRQNGILIFEAESEENAVRIAMGGDHAPLRPQ